MFSRGRPRPISWESGATSRRMPVLRRPTGLNPSSARKSSILQSGLAMAMGAEDLTDEPVKFFPIYSYLIVYRPETKPLQVVAIVHGRRDVEELLKDRL